MNDTASPRTTFPKTIYIYNIFSENRPSQKESSIPTFNLQGFLLLVSGSVNHNSFTLAPETNSSHLKMDAWKTSHIVSSWVSAHFQVQTLLLGRVTTRGVVSSHCCRRSGTFEPISSFTSTAGRSRLVFFFFFRGHSFSWMSARGGGGQVMFFFFKGGKISMEKCLCILLCIFLHILLIFFCVCRARTTHQLQTIYQKNIQANNHQLKYEGKPGQH